MLGAGALGRPRGMEWGGRREEGSGWGTHVYLWWIHVDIWQNQYNIVKLKNKIKLKKKKEKLSGEGDGTPLQYSCLENPMDGGAWKAAVHGVAEGRTRLEWTTLSSRGSFRPGDQTLISCIGRRILYH